MKKKVKKVRSMGRDLNANTAWIYTWDAASNAEYIKIGGTKHSCGTKVLREGLMIDFDALGNVVGVEILTVRPIK